MFARVIGKLISVCPAIKYGLLYTRLFERVKHLALERNNGCFNAIMEIPRSLCDDFNWWITKLTNNNNNTIRRSEFCKEIFSDASEIGWGIYCDNVSSQGFWSVAELDHHINYLELLAAFFGLKCFAKALYNCSILCRIDNTTAIAYINRMGSVHFPKLNDLARIVWKWCEERVIFIFASYIKSIDNRDADATSRVFQIDIEWSIADSAYEKLVAHFGEPKIDLFASRVNKKCECYVAWQNDPDAFAVDAFTLNWGKIFFYAFPPFAIILKTLHASWWYLSGPRNRGIRFL